MGVTQFVAALPSSGPSFSANAEHLPDCLPPGTAGRDRAVAIQQQGQALEFPLSRYARRRYGRHFRCLPLGRSESSRLLIGSRMTRAYLG